MLKIPEPLKVLGIIVVSEVVTKLMADRVWEKHFAVVTSGCSNKGHESFERMRKRDNQTKGTIVKERRMSCFHLNNEYEKWHLM